MPLTPSLLISAIIAPLVAGLVGQFPVQWLLNYLWRRFYALPGSEESVGTKDVYKATRLFITVLGFFERVVYSGSWLLGSPEIIAVILALKVTPSLKEWSENKMLGRAQFNIWLTGNLMNIIESVLIAEMVRAIVASYIH